MILFIVIIIVSFILSGSLEKGRKAKQKKGRREAPPLKERQGDLFKAPLSSQEAIGNKLDIYEVEPVKTRVFSKIHVEQQEWDFIKYKNV